MFLLFSFFSCQLNWTECYTQPPVASKINQVEHHVAHVRDTLHLGMKKNMHQNTNTKIHVKRNECTHKRRHTLSECKSTFWKYNKKCEKYTFSIFYLEGGGGAYSFFSSQLARSLTIKIESIVIFLNYKRHMTHWNIFCFIT